jgi:two-component system sensor histidine kinase DctS
MLGAMLNHVSRELPFDFALLQQTTRGHPGRSRRALVWLVGLLALTVGSIVVLVLYLDTFEAEEEALKGRSDALVIEQAAQFHFRRLEDDLMVLATQSALGNSSTSGPQVKSQSQESDLPLQGGLLWREPGVVLSHGWMAANNHQASPFIPARWVTDRAAHPRNVEQLDSMRDISRGLRRVDYAGPLWQSDGTRIPVVWLAVPYFERGQFQGSYVAAISMNAASQALIPAWFERQQRVRLQLDDDQIPRPESAWPHSHTASLNLPGTDLFLEVAPRTTKPATVPRIFFLLAILFLVGMVVSLFVLRRDFVKRQKMQVLLQAEVALRYAMENSVTMGLRAWDLHGTILHVNEAFCRMVGRSANELVGKSAPLPYWPSDQTNELGLVHRDIITQGTTGDGVEVQFQHRDGHLLDVLIHEAPLNTADGEQIGWMSSVLDISERKRSQRMAAAQQDKLEASGRLVAVGEVASTLAHELNQPLGALSSFSNGLLNRLRGGSITLEEMEPVVARMAGLAERAGGIIQRVNAFARRRELSRDRLDLRAMLRRVLPPTVELHGTDTIHTDPAEPIWIDADELLLEHLINNLVGNAQDWAPRGRSQPLVRVGVKSDIKQCMASLVVSDTGPGVSQDDQAHIFNAFFSAKEGGMGMGLAICRSIVEAHHGRIEVGRDADLGGARFTVFLPLGVP